MKQIYVISISVYWLLIGLSIITLVIDWGIKLKDNENGSEGKEQINKHFRNKLFGVFILVAVGFFLSLTFGVMI